MATVIALQSFVGRLESDVLGPSRIERHSQFQEPSVFPGPVVKQGRKIEVVKGQRFEDNHPAVKKWPTMFGAVEHDHVVEQATAEPGQKRTR